MATSKHFVLSSAPLLPIIINCQINMYSRAEVPKISESFFSTKNSKLKNTWVIKPINTGFITLPSEVINILYKYKTMHKFELI